MSTTVDLPLLPLGRGKDLSSERGVECPDRKSTRLNSSHTDIYSLSLHDALPISWVASLGFVHEHHGRPAPAAARPGQGPLLRARRGVPRSEEHTSELQSHRYLLSFPTRRSSDLMGRFSRICP